MADSLAQNVACFSSAKPCSENLGASTARPVPDQATCLLKTVQPSASSWRGLLADMLNENNRAHQLLAALALEEAIYQRHQELTSKRSYDAESMLERLKMKDAFLRVLDVKSQRCFADRDPGSY
jgi:hypothetical protein